MNIKYDFNSIDWITIQKYHDQGLFWSSIQKKFQISYHALEKGLKLGLIKKHFHKKSHSKETKNKMSILKKKFLKENPDKHPWKNKNKHISIPCEFLKKILKDNGFTFHEEYCPLSNRFYSLDIAFINNKIALEINGNQHYNSDGTLKQYYLNRHNEIEKSGWKLYEIHYLNVYNKNFIEKLLDSIKNNYILKEEIFIVSLKPKKYCQTKKEYNDKRANLFNVYLQKIKESNVKIGELDWLQKMVIITGLSIGKIRRTIKRFCLKTDIKKNFNKKNHLPQKEYYDNIRKNYFDSQKKYIPLILNSKINFTKLGWVTKVSKIINQKPQHVSEWMKKIMPLFYETCFRRNMVS